MFRLLRELVVPVTSCVTISVNGVITNCVHVAGIPVLVWVVAVAVPELDLVTIVHAAVREVHAFPAFGPFNATTACN